MQLGTDILSNSGSDVPMGNWTTSCGEKVVQGVLIRGGEE
jgi:hypothetical protein